MSISSSSFSQSIAHDRFFFKMLRKGKNMATDFSLYADGLSSPARHAAAITPHDTNDLANTSRGIIIGVGGTIKVITVGGDTVTMTVATGAVLALMVTRIFATGTTATNIATLY